MVTTTTRIGICSAAEMGFGIVQGFHCDGVQRLLAGKLLGVAAGFAAHEERDLAKLLLGVGGPRELRIDRRHNRLFAHCATEMRGCSTIVELEIFAEHSQQVFLQAHHQRVDPGVEQHVGWRGRGVFVAISPWNFPLAIFLGQVTAALMAGNSVIAKPAEQTPLIAFEAVRLLHEAGVPPSALHLLPGDGRIGAALVAHHEVAGVVFTGSTEVARAINRALAAKDSRSCR